MISPIRHLALPLAAILTFIPASARAALTLVINTNSQKLALTGSSFGIPRESGGLGSVNFGIRGIPGGGTSFGFKSVPSSAGFYTTIPEDSGPTLNLNILGDEFQISFLFENSGEVTLSGTDVFIDYTSLDSFSSPGAPLPSESLESIPNGSTLMVLDGTGFDGGISVNVIPEPSFLLLGMLGGVMLVTRRKRLLV